MVAEHNMDLNEEKPEDPGDDVSVKPVYRPWYVYLMAIWAFFGIGSLSMSFARSISGGDQQMLQILSLLVLGFTIVMIIQVIRMNKLFLILFGSSCIVLALWCCLNLLGRLFIQPVNPIIYLLLYYILPSVVLAFLSLRPTFLSLADDYRKFKRQEWMIKLARKKTGT